MRDWNTEVVFIVIGIVGVLILLVTLLLDDVLEDAFDSVEALDWLSGPVIGAALASFGVLGWTVTQADDVSNWLGVAVGAGGAVVFGYGTYRLMKGLTRVATDSTPQTNDLIGVAGRVVTAVPETGLGEVLVRMGGQPVKLSARSIRGVLARGTPIVVVEAESATRVVVERADDFWDPGEELPAG